MNDRPNDSPATASTSASAAPGPGRPSIRFTPAPGQAEIWFSAAASPDANCAYNETYVLRLTGPFVEDALVQALTQLADLHPILRGSFAHEGKSFVIATDRTLSVACHDFSSQSASDREDAVLGLLASDTQTPYALDGGSLYRPNFVRLSATECVLILGLHQAICDDWSIEVLLTDLSRLYAARLGYRPYPAHSRYSFTDYVNRCESPEYRLKAEASRRYWRQQFETLPPDLELPYDGRRPKLRSYGAQHACQKAPFELRGLVETFAQSHGLTPAEVCLTAFGALLHRISGAADLVVGVALSGQDSATMGGCVGQFTNLLPLRFRFTPEQTFLELCQLTHEALNDAREHATVAFSQIISDVNAQRDPARIPLVSVIFTHTVRPAQDDIRIKDCATEFEQNTRSSEIFEFNLNLVESRDCLLLSTHSNADLYSRAWTQRRLSELEELLTDGCREPTKAVDSLTLLQFEQYSHIWHYSNSFGQDYPRDQTVSDLFETQVALVPDAVALRKSDRAMRYLALDQRANQLAHTLRRRGVGRGHLVGICVNRGLDMVAVVLATHKAGAAYVPLDPAFPPDRLRYMIEDSGLSLVVSESSLAECHTCPKDRTLNIDESASSIDAESTSRLLRDGNSARSNDPAYLIYTSGSTGKPKGVCVHHRAAVNFLTSMRSKPGLAAHDRLLAVTTLSFDIALLELLLPLTVGGEVVLATRDDAVDGSRLMHLLQSTNATIMQATPVSWRLLLEAGWRGHRGFKALCGGEPLPSDLAEALLNRVGQLWNMYGPTETTVWSTCCQIMDARHGITVGRPINNTSIWILDSRLQPCPIGVPGEIHIGGDGVALGYHKRPELTLERFIPNPYDETPGARLYKTGDIGRWRDGGALECLGRTDSQVKIRGFRIELGEIESALSHLPGVNKAAVVARGATDNVQLVAYIVTDVGYTGDMSSREALKTNLPDYMVPGIFIHLSEFPLTPNGKLDRKALPDADASTQPAENIEPPDDALEATILDLWQTELGRQSIGVTSNFFDLGGHSLLAVRIFNGIFQQFGVRLHIATLIEYPSVRQLACRIRELTNGNPNAAKTTWSTVVPIQTRGDLPPLFCVAGLGGNALNLRALATALRMQQPFYGLQHRGVDGALPPHRTFEAMATEFLEDIRDVQPHGPYYLAGYSTGGAIAYELARILLARGESVGAVILLDSNNPTSLNWPLRARIMAHVDRIKRTGPKYIWSRTTATLQRRIHDMQRMVRAQLAQARSYEYRNDAVVEATLEAERNYAPQPIAADIFLVQTDFPLPELEGIGYPPHESNGWRDVDRGNLQIMQVQCNHEDLISARVAPTTGAIVRHILRMAQAKRVNEEAPPPSLVPNWFKSGAIPYYVPSGDNSGGGTP